ncbi:MAG: cation-translocating P-type ATPase [Anaerolineales bacterium]|nr:cation-translocating P-type ATPase [Anaerolineales bacterium]
MTASNPPRSDRLELPIAGMDCAECAAHVRRAIAAVPGVQSVEVLPAAEKAIIQAEVAQLDIAAVRAAVEAAGYSVPQTASPAPPPTGVQFNANTFTRQVLTLLAVVFGAVLFVVVLGEWLGLFEQITERVPWPLGWLAVLLGGWPVFRNVLRAALKRQVTSHTLMSVGVLAALTVGEWATAAVVVFFMRVGDYVESFTAERARRAVKDLTALAPQTARVERDGVEQLVPLSEVQVGEVVIVRPGDQIPVDGEVIAGQATVEQAAITGEAMPVEVGPGARVFAATFARLGSLRVRATHIGPDSTFGRVIQLVEQAEAHRADVQRFADRFSAWYLPLVAAIATLTFVFRQDPLATAAVLVVACSCSIALATPIAILASIGAAARRGLLIKGGKYLEALARADVLLLDKTGTLTLGRPRLTDIVPLNGLPADDVLRLAASAERYSEHPLAEAVRAEARARGLLLAEPEQFEAVPGLGVRAVVNGSAVTVGSRRLLAESPVIPVAASLEAEGKTLLFVAREGEPVGVLAAADTLRPEVPAALESLRALGFRHIELLTGDNERTASALAAALGVRYRANLLPEDKIAVVKAYQAQGRTVVMVGDGVNDAPALAQADVGVALGAAGSGVALEAAHLALMREDWALVPEAVRIARRTMGVVKGNLIFTAVYNVIGLTLAALGYLPPVLAAAAQSLPDLGILANSSRLLRQKGATD